MMTESGTTGEKTTQGAATADTDMQSHRRIITPPSLAPALPKEPPRGLYFTILVAVLVLSGLAHLTGAPVFISASLFAIGLAGMVLLSRSLGERARTAEAITENASRNRAEIETLADRMWELQESEERFRGLIDALGDLVVHRDRDGRIVYANKVFAELIGQDPRDLAGRTLAELGVDVGVVPDAAFADGECLSSTDVGIRSIGVVRWFSWIELSVRDKASNAVSHRAIARDITARKRAEAALIGARERAEYASQAKSRFLATVSHEIRTPMNGIMGMAKLLHDTELSPEQRTYVGAVSTSASALLALIEDLLDYSKIEAGRFDPEPQPMSPREIADNVVELLASRAFGKGIGLGCHVAPNVPQMISADPGRVRQVLLNLIGNAIKFTDAGGVRLNVERTGDDHPGTIRFTVTDTGPGLRAEDVERIFEEFEQADGTSTRSHGGAGLGLAISKRLVTAMGGTITVTSQPGEGSKFAFELPAFGATDTPQADADALAGRRAVILSKNTTEAEALAETIRGHGGHADIAVTPEQAAAFAKGCNALLVDAALEENDGRMLKQLRERGFAASEAVTLIAPTDRGLLGELRASGYATFLARPVRGETLLRVLLANQGVVQGKPQLASRRTAAKPANRPQLRGLSVLIAEDNDINAMLARAVLVKAGHRVDVVNNGKAAVEAVTGARRKRRYDVVLMDMHMPVMDGLDAISAIRRHEEQHGLAAVPIMVLSADSQEKTRHAVLAHGASGFVTKPLDPDVLINLVEQRAAA
ncbi:PAS domain S-box-containing protein [Aminobacter lissarensis]|uniref:Sensory/regulatory protein RpfC n=1 Tax=Aminobacter carboxidus TaxID=376165 RepID=A0A8E1WFK2_9HYPH|nr:ATP-binding protein [Aminobacter lissarensis]MBB6467537.1 PAS domain S-box-containing protein [Aminobacter lissarensis]